MVFLFDEGFSPSLPGRFTANKKQKRKRSFPLKISSVNVTKSKSAVSCGFGHIYGRNCKWKLSFLCSVSFGSL